MVVVIFSLINIEKKSRNLKRKVVFQIIRPALTNHEEVIVIR